MTNIGVTIDGNNFSQYCESLEREAHLCQPGHVFHLRLAANAPTASLQPWSPITLTEQGTLVLTGYCERIEFNRPPTHIMVHGKDTWKRATDWFIPDNLFSGGETVAYWADYLCDLVGLSYTIIAKQGGLNAVKPDLQLGLKHVSEALLAICAYAMWCIRVSPSGVVEFRNTTLPKTATRSITVIEESDEKSSDIDTRNAVKVWGYSTGSAPGSRLMYSETRVVPGISPDRIMVFGDPNLDTYSKARGLGKAALDQFADITRQSTKRIIPIPALQVGDMIRYFSSGSTTSYYQTATDLHSRMTTRDYDQNVTLGRRCFRLPAFPLTSGSFGFLCWGDCLQEITFDRTSDVYSNVSVCEAPSSIGIVAPNGSINGDWHVERRNMQYQTIWAVNKPVPNPGLGTQHYEYLGTCVTDDLFMYTGGVLTDLFQSGPLVEKRYLSDGVAVWSIQYGTAPGIGSNRVIDMDVDSTGLYCSTVYSGTPWLEKRNLSDGSQNWAGAQTYYILGVSADDNALYVCGTGGNVRKHNLTTGAQIWANTPGSVQCNDIKVGFDGIYVATKYTWTSGSTGLAVEKYDKDSGALVYRVYREEVAGTAFRLAIRGHCLFVTDGQYLEHRNTGDGLLKVRTLLTNFGSNVTDMTLFPADLVMCSAKIIQQRTF